MTVRKAVTDYSVVSTTDKLTYYLLRTDNTWGWSYIYALISVLIFAGKNVVNTNHYLNVNTYSGER